MEKRIVITGAGVIAPNAIGREKFWNQLEDGKSGVKDPRLLDLTYFKSKLAAECSDFAAEEFLGAKGLRNLDRTTLLVCSAAKLALEDAGFTVTEENADEIGVVTATTLSIASDIANFCKEVAESGFKFSNPALFPPTTMNFPSSQISIRYKIKGFNTTVSSGYTASLDALKYAMLFIKTGRARSVLVSGVEGLVFSHFVGFSKAGFLAGVKGPEISCPFDKRRNGIVLGEGAAALLLEDETSARERKARIYAEVLAAESFFDALRPAKYDPQARGLRRAMEKALENARLNTEDIDCVSASANSVPEQDKLETAAIKDLFGVYAPALPVTAIKSMIGESVSAGGVFQIAAAMGMINRGIVYPTINYEEPDPDCDLDYVPNQARKQQVNTVLINNFGPGGGNASAVIGKYI